MDERWLPIAGFEDIYEVSDAGRVRGLSRVDRQGRAVRGRERKLVPDKDGYLTVGLSCDGTVTMHKAHHLVLNAFSGERPEGHEGGHLNGVRSDNRAVNLKWITKAENYSHMEAHGTRYRGEKHFNSRLSVADVERIRECKLFGARNKDLGAVYGVNPGYIPDVVTGRTWASVGAA